MAYSVLMCYGHSISSLTELPTLPRLLSSRARSQRTVGALLTDDQSVKYQTLPAVHLRHVTSPTSVTTTVGHEVDVEGESDTWSLCQYVNQPLSHSTSSSSSSSYLFLGDDLTGALHDL